MPPLKTAVPPPKKPAATPLKASSPPVKKPPTKKPAVPAVPERPVVYPKLEHYIYCLGGDKPPITYDFMKELLGWEHEEDYAERRMAECAAGECTDSELTAMYAEDPEKAKAAARFDDTMPLIGTDIKGRRVVCWNNDRNRPFDESHARKLGQDQLNRQWAGPTTMPGETINGESFIISRTGRVESGQHRGVGFMHAWEEWDAINTWKELWPTEPVLETLIVFGVSESPKVTQTLDNVKPRTLADSFYTSEIFRSLTNLDKKECSRMLDAALDLLWKRVKASSNSGNKYQTHSASREFLDNHPKLIKCVEHLFQENKERAISGLNLSAGQSAGLMYLMATGNSNGDQYHAQDPLTEKKLKWDLWEKAASFWAQLASGHQTLDPVKTAIACLADDGSGSTGGRLAEKFTILSKAWSFFKQGAPFTQEDVTPEYEEDKDEHDVVIARRLAEQGKFGNIDLGEPKKKTDAIAGGGPTKEETENAKAVERKNKAAAAAGTIAAAKAAPEEKTYLEQLAEQKKKHGDRVLLFLGSGKQAKVVNSYTDDAAIVAEVLGREIVAWKGIALARSVAAELDDDVKSLNAAGYRVAVIEQLDGQKELTATYHDGLKPVAKPAPGKKK